MISRQSITGFKLEMNALVYEYSDIDMTREASLRGQGSDYFQLFDFSAKEDPVPTMLTQCHINVVRGFMGQTTGYNMEFIKPEVLILGENKALHEARYIHGEFGNGTWTFYSGHDPG